MANSRFHKPRDVRQLRSVGMSDDDQERVMQLRALRIAIAGISTRPWTDDEWAGWVRRWLPEVAEKLRAR